MYSKYPHICALTPWSQNDLYNEWRPFYLDYNFLKRELKVCLFYFVIRTTASRPVALRPARLRTIGTRRMRESSYHCLRKSSIRSTTFKRLRCVLHSISACTSTYLSPIHSSRQTLELSRRIKDAEKAVKRLVTEEYVNSPSSPNTPAGTAPRDHTRRSEDAEAQGERSGMGVAQDAGSDDDSDDSEDDDLQSVDALEDQFLSLEEEVATLVADVHDLALYTKLNITGFMKILKVGHTRLLRVTC